MLRLCSPQLGVSPTSNLGGAVYDREILKGLAQLVANFWHCEYCHTHSHKGAPWNELADTLAKYASSTEEQRCTL